MRVIAHISDLHFGYNDAMLARALSETLWELSPDVLVISGDLVEHATDQEYGKARAYLDALPKPLIVVPGNHDLPFYNLWRRVTEGLNKYREYISEELEPAFLDDEIAIIGVNSAHLFPVKGGKVTHSQLDRIVDQFMNLPEPLIRILVTHHPFDLPEPSNPRLIIGHARRAVARLAPVVDILLAGHVHVSSTGSTSTRYKINRQAMAFVQAGTAISDRRKGEMNSFNLIEASRPESGRKRIVVHRYSWKENAFVRAHSDQYEFGEKGWAAAELSSPSEETATPNSNPR